MIYKINIFREGPPLLIISLFVKIYVFKLKTGENKGPWGLNAETKKLLIEQHNFFYIGSASESEDLYA